MLHFTRPSVSSVNPLNKTSILKQIKILIITLVSLAASDCVAAAELPIVGQVLENKELGSKVELYLGQFITREEQKTATAGVRAMVAQWIAQDPSVKIYVNYYEWDPSIPADGRDPAQTPGDDAGKREARSGTFAHQVVDGHANAQSEPQVTGVLLSAETEKTLKKRFGNWNKKENIYTAARIIVPGSVNAILLSVGPVPMLSAVVMGATIAAACGVIAWKVIQVLNIQLYFRFWNKAITNPDPKTKFGRMLQELMVEGWRIGEKDEQGKVKYAWPEKPAFQPKFADKGQSVPLTKFGKILEFPHSLLNFFGFEVAFGIPMVVMSDFILDLGQYTGHYETIVGFLISAAVSTGAQGTYEAWVGKLKEMEDGKLGESKSELNAKRRAMWGSLMSVLGFSLTRYYPVAGYSILGALGAFGLVKKLMLPKEVTDTAAEGIACNNTMKGKAGGMPVVPGDAPGMQPASPYALKPPTERYDNPMPAWLAEEIGAEGAAAHLGQQSNAAPSAPPAKTRVRFNAEKGTWEQVTPQSPPQNDGLAWDLAG